MSVLLIVGVIIVLILLWLWGTYNRLITLRNQVQNSWSQIDVQLQRRYDLIPNLVESVKGYMQYERGTLEAVIQARNQASAALSALKSQGGPTESSIKELVAAEGALKGGLGQIFALAENYPDLKASQNMQQLQEELTSTENKVSFARQAYNDSVLLYNTSQQQFPTNLVATTFGHKASELFEVKEAAAKDAVKVKF